MTLESGIKYLLTITNPEGAVQSYTYNASRKTVTTINFDSSADSIEYNAMGKPEKVTNKRRKYKNIPL